MLRDVQVLGSAHQEAFQHDTGNGVRGSTAVLKLGTDFEGNLCLPVVALAAVGVARVHDQAWVESLAGQFAGGAFDVVRGVVGSLPSAAEDDMGVGVSCG